MGSDHPEVDRYLITLPSRHRKALRALRAGDHVVCSLASQKHHISLHIRGDAVLEPFREELAGLDRGRACVRFRSDEEFSPDLAKWIIERAVEVAAAES